MLLFNERELKSWPILKGLMDCGYEIVLALVILGLLNDVLSCLAVTLRVTIREKALMA